MELYEYYKVGSFKQHFTSYAEALDACKGNTLYIKRIKKCIGVSDSKATQRRYL